MIGEVSHTILLQFSKIDRALSGMLAQGEASNPDGMHARTFPCSPFRAAGGSKNVAGAFGGATSC